MGVDRTTYQRLQRALRNPRLRRLVRFLLRRTGLRPVMIRVFRHRGLRPTDAFIASYPRSGNTWLRFLLYEAISGEPATFVSTRAIPYLGEHLQAPPLLPGDGRLLKTHERFHPAYPKAVYLIRDPRDVVLSDFNYARLGRLFPDDLDAFIDDFIEGRVHAFGSWTEHVSSWLDSPIAHQGDLLVVRYEDIKRDAVTQLDRILRFLGVERSRDALESAVGNNTVDLMREKEDANPNRPSRPSGLRFVNKGEVGGWTEELTASQVQKIQAHAAPVLERLRESEHR